MFAEEPEVDVERGLDLRLGPCEARSALGHGRDQPIDRAREQRLGDLVLAAVALVEGPPGDVRGDEDVVDPRVAALRDVFTSRNQEGGLLHRYRIDLAHGRVSGKKLSDAVLEFPQFDPRASGRPSDVVFGAVLLDNETPGFFNGLARIDVASGRTSVRDLGPGRFTSEPIFVPAHPDAAEAEGYLLSVVFDADRGASELLITRADDLDEDVAQVRLEHHVPYGFHGTWTESVFVE